MAQNPAQDLAANPKASAALALHRFGLGPRERAELETRYLES